MAVGISQGNVQFAWGNFATRRLVLDGAVNHTDYGMIEYKFVAAEEKILSVKQALGLGS